jgi:predicted DNA-binding transcriptional regulator YafY
MEIVMSRAERLLDLVEEFMRQRRSFADDELVQTFGISIRTLYRDIASLRALGAEGEPGRICFALRVPSTFHRVYA